MSLRILTVASEVPPRRSGVARSVGGLVEGLRQRDHHVDVLSASDAPYYQRGEFRLSALASRLPAVARRSAEYDLVHVHGPVPTITEPYLAAATRRTWPPRVVYTHHFTMQMPQRWLAPFVHGYNAVLGAVARRVDALVVTTPTYATLLSDLGPPVSVIPWGTERPVDPPVETGARERGTLKVLYVGQLRPYKGVDVAVEAAHRVPGIDLSIVGAGPMASSLARQVVRGGSGQVDLVGPCTDAELVARYRDADVVVLPSRSRLEAFGIVLVEGMGFGCVPVASDLPGVRDVVGDAGLLVAPDSVDDLVWAFEFLRTRPDLLDRLRRRALRRADQYGQERTVDAYERLFLELAEAPDASPAVDRP